jgi:hypothetical protein
VEEVRPGFETGGGPLRKGGNRMKASKRRRLWAAIFVLLLIIGLRMTSDSRPLSSRGFRDTQTAISRSYLSQMDTQVRGFTDYRQRVEKA